MSFKSDLREYITNVFNQSGQFPPNSSIQEITENNGLHYITYEGVPVAIATVDNEQNTTVYFSPDIEHIANDDYLQYWSNSSEKFYTRFEKLNESYEKETKNPIEYKFSTYIESCLEKNTNSLQTKDMYGDPNKKVIFDFVKMSDGETEKVVIGGAIKDNDNWLVSVSENFKHINHPIERDLSKIENNSQTIVKVFNDIQDKIKSSHELLMPEDRQRFFQICKMDLINALHGQSSLFFEDIKTPQNGELISEKIGPIGSFSEASKIKLNADAYDKLNDFVSSTSFKNFQLAIKNESTIQSFADVRTKKEDPVQTNYENVVQIAENMCKKIDNLGPFDSPSQEIKDKCLLTLVEELKNTALGKPSSEFFNHFTFIDENKEKNIKGEIISSLGTKCGTINDGNVTLYENVIASLKDYIEHASHKELKETIALAPEVYKKGIEIQEERNVSINNETKGLNDKDYNSDDIEL